MAQVSSYVLHASEESRGTGVLARMCDIYDKQNSLTLIRTENCRALRILFYVFDDVDEVGDLGEEWVIVREAMCLF